MEYRRQYNKQYYLKHKETRTEEAKEKKKAYLRQYYQDNKEKLDAQRLQWRKDNREKSRLISNRYRQNNRDELNKKGSERYHINLEESRRKGREYYHKMRDDPEVRKRNDEYIKKYRLEHVVELKEYSLYYNRRPERKEYHRKRAKEYRMKDPEKYKVTNAKYRQLGFIPLNDYFDGAHAHHMDTEVVMYIPAEIHNGNKHTLTDHIKMADINDKAWEWYFNQHDNNQMINNVT